MTQHNDPLIHETIERMEAYGGSFASALAVAYAKADPDNQQLIIDTWPELFKKYGPTGIFSSPQQRVHSYGYELTKRLTIRPSK
tara:strand:- start:1483 stop:1734 length:252 start_codon:yes stop_codon:yes gene_type:complete